MSIRNPLIYRSNTNFNGLSMVLSAKETVLPEMPSGLNAKGVFKFGGI